MPTNQPISGHTGARPMLDRIIRFFLEQKLIVVLLMLALVGWGVATAPFNWQLGSMPRDPVPVDAMPNLGENQQIVFTEWPGRSPQDIDDQVTYPLTVELMGLPGVKEVRSQSMFGFSMIFVVFEEDVEFYWSRSRIVEKLNSLSPDTLPDGVSPSLGPDATALGQVFWYTLEGRDPDGNPTGGWDLQELRSIQDWYVRQGLLSATGITEVASIGGYVPEYQVKVDPEAMRAHDVTLPQVLEAVRESNLDVSAGVTEINRVEYMIRGKGFIKNLTDIELATVAVRDGDVPLHVKDVAEVTRAPAPRRGALTVGGAEAVGGVTVVREGYNPLQGIQNVKAQIEEIAPGLPAKAVIDWDAIDRDRVAQFAQAHDFKAFASPEINQDAWLSWLRDTPREQWPDWVTLSQLEIVPFYDRSNLIDRTLGTLNDALVQQILVTVLVVVVLVLHLRSALVISAMLPLAVLMSFVMMKLVGVEANVVSLAGIAISIGTIVAMGIIVTENVLKHLNLAEPGESRLEVVFRGTREVGSAVLAAIATTVISFLPVFTMSGAEGKMFVPLAYTKTFVLVAAIFIALTILPAAVHVIMAGRYDPRRLSRLVLFSLGVGAVAVFTVGLANDWLWIWVAGLFLLAVTLYHLLADYLPVWIAKLWPRWVGPIGRLAQRLRRVGPWAASAVAALLMAWLLARVWEPLGPEPGALANALFVAGLIGGLLALAGLFIWLYGPILRWCLRHKLAFLTLPAVLVLLGATIWLGFDRLFSFVPRVAEAAGVEADPIHESEAWSAAAAEFPGLDREFMPDFDEGSFLWMPIISYHGSIGESLEALKFQSRVITNVPEVKNVYGKLGRVDSALDPAPVGMHESIVHYKSEYKTDDSGRRINFAYDTEKDQFKRDAEGNLIRDEDGRPYRQWRDHIESPADIWDAMVEAAQRPGITRPTMLQPIETRLIMLQTGMTAPMGLKVRAPDLETLETIALELEEQLRAVPAINAETVKADRVVGKPYLEIQPDRRAISRFGLNVEDVQKVIATALGGRTVTKTVEGRERYPVRVRYPRERRREVEQIERMLVPAPDGTQVPLKQVADIRYERGPQMIRSEDTFLTAYVTFAPERGRAEVEVVEQARQHLTDQVESGALAVPEGVSWRFAGDYESQQRATRTLAIVLPVALVAIFLILYFQFSSVWTTLNVFSGILIAWAGGFIMIYLYGEPWFADFTVLGTHMRELFNMQAIDLSVAVWVGFLALFGIAVDNGVLVATHLDQSFARYQPDSIGKIRAVALRASQRRVRPCLMIAATTVLALLPVLTSTGTGADIMIPMAIPSVGGMLLVLLTLFTVPVLYSLVEERKCHRRHRALTESEPAGHA